MQRVSQHCDLTGEPIATAAVPLVVRITVAPAAGATTDPRQEQLSPFLRAMLFHPDGRPRPGVLELGASSFEAGFRADMDALGPAFQANDGGVGR